MRSIRKYGDPRSDSQTLATGNVPLSMLSREEQDYTTRLDEARNTAYNRAQAEMGYEGGPITPLLEKLGIDSNEYYNRVYDRMDDLLAKPMRTRRPGVIEQELPELESRGLMYNNGGRLGDRMRQRRENRQMRRYLKDDMRRRDPMGERAGADVLLESLGEYGPDSISDMQEDRRQNRKDYAKVGKTMATIGGLGSAVSAAYGRLLRDRQNTPMSGERITLRDILKEIFAVQEYG